LSKTVLTMY